jgi:outer membrane protein assembly factor BamB
MSKWRLVLAVCSLTGVCFADSARDLQLAARSGDLKEVRRLVESGVPVDSSYAYGPTALSLAAGQGRLEVVSYLLEKGADPNARESFFGVSVLDVALWKGEPDFTVAKMLLEAGAKDRATALFQAFESGNVDLARAAAKSGPVLESEAKELRAHFTELSDELKEILAGVKTEPDPSPPSYSAKQLAGFAGKYFGRDGATATVEVKDGKLVLDYDGARTTLAATADRIFRNSETGMTLRYFGRAGTVEGLSIQPSGQSPIRMGLGDPPVVGAADLPKWVEDPNAEPTVNWAGFRGKNRDGIGDGADTPVEFDLESGDGVAWSVDLPGLGNSSPVIWGERVYVTTAVAAGGSTPLKTGLTGAGDEVEENSEHRWLLLAYDKSSGKKVWETEVGRGVPLTKRHFKATQANSSPATDGEHIVVVFPTAGLACVGRDGALHWKHELGGLNAGGFNDPGMQWGFAASPIIHAGKVILQVDIHDGPYLAAWDLDSGKQLWKTDRPDVAPSWATPAIWRTPQGDELIVNASIIRGYDPASGRELWSLGPTSIQVVASPVVGAKNLFVSSGYPPARPIYAVKPGIRGDHKIESDDDAKPLAWYQTRGGAYMPTPLLYRGLLYVVHHNGRIVAHDARSGERVYQARFSAGGTCTASPVVANGKIYQGTEEGTLYVLAAGPEHNELAVHEFGEPLMATPAISEGLLLVRTPSKLIALGKKSAKAR